MGDLVESGGSSLTDARLSSLYSMLSTDPEDDLSQEQKGRSDQIGSKLKSLDTRWTKQQASEAEKFKVLRMVLDKIEDDTGVEKISLDTLRDRYDQEIKSLESNALLDLNIHRASRRDLDTALSKKIDEKFGVFRQELMEEKQRRMDAARRHASDIMNDVYSSVEGKDTILATKPVEHMYIGRSFVRQRREKSIYAISPDACPSIFATD